MSEFYFSGQGKVYIAERDSSGNPLALRLVGNVPELKLSLETEKVEHKESMSGQRLTDLRIVTGKTGKGAFTLEEWTNDNLALGLYGEKATVAGDSVTDEVFPADLVVGDYVRLANPKASNLSVEDSLSAALTLDTHYEVTSADHGLLKILNLGAFTQPFQATYDYAARVDIGMFKTASPPRWLLFAGLNTAVEDGSAFKPVLVELFKFSSDPVTELAIITDELSPLEINGNVLADTLKAADSSLGQFGRITWLG